MYANAAARGRVSNGAQQRSRARTVAQACKRSAIYCGISHVEVQGLFAPRSSDLMSTKSPKRDCQLPISMAVAHEKGAGHTQASTMSVESGDTASSPDWGALSEELHTLLTNEGPLPYGPLRARYEATLGRQLDFHGHKLRDSLANGNLKGIRFNTTNHTLELGTEPARVETLKVLPPTPPSRSPPDSALLPDEPLARKLRALVTSGGPLPMDDISKQYRVVYGEVLNLHGYRLRARLKDGNLPGLAYSTANGTLGLADALTPDAAAPSPPEGHQLADEFRRLVVKEGPLLLSNVSPMYSSLYHKKCKEFGEGGLLASLRQGELKGVRYDESSGRMALDDRLPSATGEPEAPQPAVHVEEPSGAADAVAPPAATVATNPPSPRANERRRAALQDAGPSAAASLKPPQVAFGRPASASKTNVMASGRVPDVGGTPRRSPSTASSPSSSPSGTKLPYLLIDSQVACKKALAAMSCMGNSLQHICMGSMVVVQLNGRQLGYEAGFISLIKVGCYYTCCFEALLFLKQRDTTGYSSTGASVPLGCMAGSLFPGQSVPAL